MNWNHSRQESGHQKEGLKGGWVGELVGRRLDGWVGKQWVDGGGAGGVGGKSMHGVGKQQGRWGLTHHLLLGPPAPFSVPEGWAYLFFNRPLKSSSPASSGFPSPLRPLKGGVNSTEVPPDHPGCPHLGFPNRPFSLGSPSPCPQGPEALTNV